MSILLFGRARKSLEFRIKDLFFLESSGERNHGREICKGERLLGALGDDD